MRDSEIVSTLGSKQTKVKLEIEVELKYILLSKINCTPSDLLIHSTHYRYLV